MNEVELSSENVEPPQRMPDLSRVAERVYGAIGRSEWEVSVLLCDDERIAELNRTYRRIDGPTDVLTFSQYPDPDDGGLAGGPVAGDIVISMPTLAANATEYGVQPEEEFLRLYIHALLHLAGFTHEGYDLSTPGAADHPMLGLQERLVAELTKELES